MKHFRFLVVCSMFLCFHAKAGETQDAVSISLRAEFDVYYDAWKQDCEKVKHSSTIDSRLQSNNFQAIIKMGPSVLPLVAEKCIQDTNFLWNGWAWTMLTKMQNDPAVNPWAKDSVRTWWEGGAKLARERSLLLLDAVKKAKQEGREADAQKALMGVRALGLLSLETLFAEFETGNDDVLPIINGILSGELLVMDKEQCRDWWSRNRDSYILPRATPANRAVPVSAPTPTEP